MTCIETNDHAVPAREFDGTASVLWAVQSSVSRNQFFSALFSLALLNCLATRVLENLTILGILAAAVTTFVSVSAVVWFACAAALSLVLRTTEKEEVRAADILLGSIVLVLVAVPLKELNWLGLDVAAVYVIWVSPSGSGMRRGGLIFLPSRSRCAGARWCCTHSPNPSCGQMPYSCQTSSERNASGMLSSSPMELPPSRFFQPVPLFITCRSPFLHGWRLASTSNLSGPQKILVGVCSLAFPSLGRM